MAPDDLMNIHTPLRKFEMLKQGVPIVSKYYFSNQEGILTSHRAPRKWEENETP